MLSHSIMSPSWAAASYLWGLDSLGWGSPPSPKTLMNPDASTAKTGDALCLGISQPHVGLKYPVLWDVGSVHGTCLDEACDTSLLPASRGSTFLISVCSPYLPFSFPRQHWKTLPFFILIILPHMPFLFLIPSCLIIWEAGGYSY